MLRVLLVDDSPLAIEGLKTHIPWENTGCECIGSALNGKEALDLALQLKPDIIITDVRMPIMDGLELCRNIQEDLPGVKLIILSAYDDFSYAQHALRYGVCHYILKPIDFQKIEEISTILQKMSKEEQLRYTNLSSLLKPEVEDWLFHLITEKETPELIQELHTFLLENLEGDPVFPPYITLVALRLLYACMQRLHLSTDILGKTLEQNLLELKQQLSPQSAVDYIIAEYRTIHEYIYAKRTLSTNTLADTISLYLQENFCNPELSANMVCRKFQISQSYLCHIFKEHNRTSITTYITQLRMTEATRLLKTTEKSIHEIAVSVGYPDSHYFTKTFKKVNGVSPSEIRKLTRTIS